MIRIPVLRHDCWWRHPSLMVMIVFFAVWHMKWAPEQPQWLEEKDFQRKLLDKNLDTFSLFIHEWLVSSWFGFLAPLGSRKVFSLIDKIIIMAVADNVLMLLLFIDITISAGVDFVGKSVGDAVNSSILVNHTNCNWYNDTAPIKAFKYRHIHSSKCCYFYFFSYCCCCRSNWLVFDAATVVVVVVVIFFCGV